MAVSYKTTLKEDNDQNWEVIPTEDGVSSYRVYKQPILKGSLDDREYRIIRLHNGLEAVIVSDKHADQSAACMNVSTGYFRDPDNMLGIAHFCEHLMFLGSKEHKQENAYRQYLSLHSGRGNAMTSGTDTTFFFHVAADALEGALTLFSEFFHCPLFHEDSALREVEAVDSEYTQALRDDAWRLAYLSRSLARPGHPLRKFNHGNKATLIGKYLVSETSHSQHKSGTDRHNHRSSGRNPRTENHGHGRASSTSSIRSSNASTRTHSETRHKDRSAASSKTSSRTSAQSNRKKVEKEESQKAEEEAEKEAAKKARKKLIEWWGKEYSADRMSLAVVGREPLDELTRMVVQYFSPIKNTGQDPTPFKSMVRPYGKEELCKTVYVKTIEEKYEITISFPLDCQDPFWRESPTHFISHVLGDEGPGSLDAYLKSKGWILNSTVGCNSSYRGCSVFNVYIKLTEDGFKNQREIILTCFKFINLLRKSTFPEWMQEEQKIIQELSFRYADKGFALPHALNIAKRLMRFETPRALLLQGPVLFWEWNEKFISDTLKELDIENCYVTVSAKNHDNIHGETWHKERWCGAEYVMKQFEPDFISEARKDNDIREFTLPNPNPFLPENFDVHRLHITEPKKRPALLERTPLMELWYKKDDQFWVPKADVKIAVRTPAAAATPRAYALTKLFVQLVMAELNEYSYHAWEAGLDYSLDATICGFTITVGGYNDKLHVLAAAEKQNLKNMQEKQPFHQSQHHLRYIITDYIKYSTEEQEEALKGITVDELSKHAKLLLSRLTFAILVTGNLKRENAFSIAAKVKETLEAKPVPEDELPKLLISIGCNYVLDLPLHDENEKNSSVHYYCHVGNASDPHTHVLCYLLAQILKEPTFDVLRTKEQLGYIVDSAVIEDLETIGWDVVIQSEMDPSYLESRIEAFLRSMRKIIQNMSDEKINSHKESLGKLWKEKPKMIRQETVNFWTTINDGYYDFRRKEKDVKLLQSISLAEVRMMFKERLDPSSKIRSKLSIHMRSQRPSKPPNVPAKPNVSMHAAQEFLIALKKEGIYVDENEYNQKCEVELTMSEMHEYLKETCLNKLVNNNEKRIQELFRKLESFLDKYPVKPALEVEHISDGGKFKQGLTLSGVPKPVEKFDKE
ncbi:uncharacterized protein FOMMEDRAFT_160677 [Fomitiporia mediterranea MF3/22]|uniref:uncharacterized protein n=1 Tax=Fomitiporia mediterranea (strain MF3/22) TaxID=694068 RepID=UPI00044086D7|nr:uncharacterized protein FOMMEDRAFT_160677 [Fomitiporia mediterranea MF3/22]EJC99116.1 hypothetical protein FOMMEDRAFT_160677 [Fomitiporia mediterranea MF3/22]